MYLYDIFAVGQLATEIFYMKSGSQKEVFRSIWMAFLSARTESCAIVVDSRNAGTDNK